MDISASTWDRWALAGYLFTIGLALGFVTGYSLGITHGSSNAVYFLLFPVIAIVIIFIALVMMAKRIAGKAS